MARALVLAALCAVVPLSVAQAYTAAGDRQFPATILLPQIAPSDEAYVTSGTQPSSGGRTTTFGGTYDKTLTERLGIEIDETYSWIDSPGAGTASGWQNQNATVRYLAILDQSREFLFTVGLEREFGDTGTRRIGADPRGATTPTAYFGKGLGDLDIGYLRPLAVTGTFGYQASDGGARPDVIQAGIALEYSIPYLDSKVRALELPGLIRSMTPMIEYFYTTTTTPSSGQSTAATIAPGFSIAGDYWEFAVEALVPTTRAAGNGPGVTVQFHLSLDYLFPGSVGKPLFSAR
jgi:hypothetical protein